MQNINNIQITGRILELIKRSNLDPSIVCDIAEMPRSSFSYIVKKNRFPWRVEWLAKIALYFDVTIDYIVFGDKDYVKKRNKEFIYESKKLIKDMLLKEKKYLTYGKLQAEGFFKELEKN
jgi:hypothetical protein